MVALDHGMARIDDEGSRAEIVITRPDKRNAMNEAVLRDLTAAFESVREMDVRAVCLLGEGAVFSAGMDLEMMRDRVETENQPVQGLFPRLLATIDETPQPVVAGVKRAAPAGAFELTLPCDFRILGEEAKYGVPEVNLGTFPHGGATQRLPRLIGLARAKSLVLTGEYIDPEEAAATGLVYDVVPEESVDDSARELADELATNAPLGVQRAKTALNAAFDMPLEEGLAYERALGSELDDTDDYREGFEARLEGRDPEFVGR